VDFLAFSVRPSRHRPSKYDRSLAGDLDLIVLKALNKERKNRFTSVEQFAAYITLYLDDRPLLKVRPESSIKQGSPSSGTGYRLLFRRYC